MTSLVSVCADRIGTGLGSGDAWIEGGTILAVVQAFICVTCGTQFAPSAEPPRECPICLDPRQYVGRKGQEWTTTDEPARTHENRVEERYTSSAPTRRW